MAYKTVNLLFNVISLTMRTSDIYPVSDFNRKPGEHIKRLQETKKPEVLTVNGKAAVVMIDPESYDNLAGAAELSRTLQQLQEVRAAYDRGEAQPLLEAYKELKEEILRQYPDANL